MQSWVWVQRMMDVLNKEVGALPKKLIFFLQHLCSMYVYHPKARIPHHAE